MRTEELELAAYAVFASACHDGGEALLKNMTDISGSLSDACADTPANWRSSTNKALRSDFRALGGRIIAALEDYGFTIKPPKPKDLDRALDAVMTIPAHRAYSLDNLDASH